jgi:DNA recombination-dependent growth factor C
MLISEHGRYARTLWGESCVAKSCLTPLNLDFTLMTGEVAKLLADVVEALGGEKAKAV